MQTVKELLPGRELFTVQTGTSVHKAVLYMAEKGVGIVPVFNGEKLIGVFSERDLVKRVIAQGKNIEETKVDEVMSKNLIIANSGEPTESILAKMKEGRTRHILIVDNDKLAAVLSMRDLLELDLSTFKTTVEVLNTYISSK
jgi:CBS domain-containing protein